MKVYDIEVKEILSRIVREEANNIDEALDIVHKKYKAENIVLADGDFVDVSIFQCGESSEEIKERLVLEVVDYLYQDEKKHFEEEASDQSGNHIFTKLKKLKLLCCQD